MWYTKAAQCEHIYAYYQWRWEQHKCIAWNLLRQGYREWSRGYVNSFNNLFGESLV